jgi:putative DNA primase/helicase
LTVLPFTDLAPLEDVLPRLGDVSAKANGSELVSACPVCGGSRRLRIVRRNDYLAEVLAPECGCQLSDVARALQLPDDYFDQGNGFRIEELPDQLGREDEFPIVWRVEREIYGADFDRAHLVVRHTRLTQRDLVYTVDGGWLLWSGTTWTQVGEDAIRALVAEVGERLTREANAVSSEAIKESEKNDLLATQLRAEAESLYKAARSFRTAKVVDGIVRSMKSLPGVGVPARRGELAPSLNDFDTDPDVIGFLNGVVNLKTGELRSYRREDKLTRRVELRFDPSAPCPRWQAFLREIFINEDGSTDEEVVSFVHRLVGYGITGHTKEEIFAVLWGSGSNGKSKFLEAIDHVFKAHTTTTPFETFEAKRSGGIPNDLAALKGARLVMASEGNANAPMAEAVIKRLSGRDPITARFMRAEFFTFAPTFLVLLATNAKPRFKGQEEGLWRRIKLIPFRKFFTPDERDHDLPEKLKAEAEGIAAWAVRGAIEWNAHGLGTAATIERETRMYRDESDQLGDFISERLNITGNPADRIKNADLYGAYSEWSYELGQKELIHLRTLVQMLTSGRGIGTFRTNAARGITGARLWTEAERAQRERNDRTVDAPSPAEVFVK